jgi:hypothetical protein
MILSESQSELFYDWRFTASASWRQAPWDPRPVFIFQTEHLRLSSSCNILSSERVGLSFTIAAGPRQRSHSQARVPWDLWPHFTVSHSRLPQPGGPGPRVYIPQKQGGPVIPPGTGFPFHRLLRLAGLRWRYSTPPLRGICSKLVWDSRYLAPGRTQQKTPFFYYCVRVPFRGNVFAWGYRETAVCWFVCCIATTVYFLMSVAILYSTER